jgi:hypothetical protein
MRLASNRVLAALVAVLLGVLVGCRRDLPTRHVGSLLPDFALLDVNPNSPFANRDVSPQMNRGTISAWYFGHAT